MKRKIFIWFLPLFLFFSTTVHGTIKEEAIYYIMIDRFNNMDVHNDGKKNMNDLRFYQGGDLAGVTAKLDYIKEMGFTVVALSPVFKSERYDGQAIVDFEQMDEHFGTLDDFKELVKKAHEKEMKVIVDFHVKVSKKHPWLQDEEKKAWFKPNQSMLDLENEDVQTYVLERLTSFVKETNVDGFRFLHVDEAPPSFWGELTQRLKTERNDLYLLAEMAGENIEQYTHLSFDAFMNKDFALKVQKTFSKVDMSLAEVNAEEEAHIISYVEDYDMLRFTRVAVNQGQIPLTRIQLALTYMYTAKATPFVAYGMEIAIDGGEGANNHRVMNFGTSAELIEYVSNLAKIRKAYPALQTGSYEPIYEKEGVLVFKRSDKDDALLIALNNSQETKVINIKEEVIGEEKELRGLLVGGTIQSGDHGFDIVLDGETAELFVIAEQKGVNLFSLTAVLLIPILFIVFLFLANKRGKRTRG